MLRKILLNANVYKIVLCLIAICWIYNPGRHASHYSYVRNEDVPRELYIAQQSNGANLNVSIFENMINNNRVVPTSEIYELKSFETVEIGGEYISKKCPTPVKTAIIVPYRDRAQQLKIFLNYMHHFIQRQCLSYRIFVVDQQDSRPFNRARLLNFGAAEAMKLNFSCLILHDVDLLPITTGNLYTCARMPRHMSSSLDVFRYVLMYPNLLGGVMSIRSDQFKEINGMSNLFEGWGGEDDDFNARLRTRDYAPYRFSPDLSKYVMLKHAKAQPSEQRFKMLEDSLARQESDGLNSLPHNYVVEQKPLYTHILIRD